MLEVDPLLMMAREEAFDTEIPDAEAGKIRTIHQAIELIERLTIEGRAGQQEIQKEAVAVAVTPQKSEEREWPQ